MQNESNMVLPHLPGNIPSVMSTKDRDREKEENPKVPNEFCQMYPCVN